MTKIFHFRPLGYAQQSRTSFRSPLASKYPRSNNSQAVTTKTSLRGTETGAISRNDNVKCNSSAAQTDISALPHQWRSETHLIGTGYGLEGFTLPSKHTAPQAHRSGVKNSLRYVQIDTAMVY